MCGICGQLSWGAPSNGQPDLLRSMNAAIRHRGPDDDGFFEGSLSAPSPFQGAVGLAMRRLSIIDVAGGKQPISNETNDVTVVYNGEVYNFAELRKDLIAAGHTFKTRTDTEVIVHGYEVWGDAVAERLNGMFAFALWDQRRGRLVLARDRMGIKPLYYADAAGRLVWGSEIKSLLKDPSISREIDPTAISDYLSLRYIPGPGSIYQAIRKLPPASLLIWEKGRTEISCYWNFDPAPPVDLGLAHYLEKLDALIDGAVKDQLVSEVPLGTFLSGGLDSPTLAYYAKRHKPDLMTFTMYFDDPKYSERDAAAMVARHLGTQHFEKEVHPDVAALVPRLVDIFDEPFGDDSMIPTYFLTQMAREKMTVALSGDGGDELFGGYRTYVADTLAPIYRQLPAWVRYSVIENLAGSRLARFAPGLAQTLRAFTRSASLPPAIAHFGWTELFKSDIKGRLMSPLLKQQVEQHASTDTFVRAFEGAGRRKGLERFLYVDQQTHLPDEFLVKVDRLSMAHSLEVRPPFLDKRLVEFAAEIPAHYKLRGLTTKWILRKLMAGRLPKSITGGGKKGFGSPMSSWIRGPLLPFIRERFAPARLKANPYLNPEEPSRLLDQFLGGRPELARRLWSLLMFVEWHERIVQGR